MAVRQEIIFKARDLASGKIIEVAASMEKLRSASRKASSESHKLSRTATRTTQALDSMGLSAKVPISAMGQLTGKLKSTGGALSVANSEIQKTKQSLSAMGLAPRRPTREISKLSSAMTTLKKRAKTLKSVLKKTFSGFGGRIKRINGLIFNLKTAFVAFIATMATKKIISIASEFEDLRTQLDALQGSSEGGRKALEWVKDFAKTTPLAMQDVTEAFVLARAFGLDPMDGTMQSLVDINSKLGGGMEKLISITRGVGQMFTKNKIQAQEMNLQLTEQGIPAWDLLAKAMNRAGNTMKFNTTNLQKMASKGELGRREVKLLIDEMGRFGKGAALAKMKDFTGLVSNLGDQMSQAANEFATADRGLFVFAKGALTFGIKKLNEFRNSGALKNWGKNVGDVMLSTAEKVLLGVSSISLALNPIFTVASKGINNILGVFNSLPAWMQSVGVIGAILLGKGRAAILIAALALLDPIIEGTKRVIRTFKGELGDSFNPEPVNNLKLSLIKLESDGGPIISSLAASLRELRVAFNEIANESEINIKGSVDVKTPENSLIVPPDPPDNSIITTIKQLEDQKSLIDLQDEFAQKTESSEFLQVGRSIERLEIEKQIAILKAQELGAPGDLLQDIDKSFEDKKAKVEIESERSLLETMFNQRVDSKNTLFNTIEENEARHQERLGEIIQKNAGIQFRASEKLKEKKIKAGKDTFTAVNGFANALFIATGSRNKALFKLTKASNIATSIMNTYSGAAKALDQGGFYGIAMAAAVIAAGLANVATISQTTLGGGVPSGGAPGTPSIPSANIPPGFPSQTTSGLAPQITINIDAIDAQSFESFDFSKIIEPIAKELGDFVEDGGQTGNVEFAVTARGA